MDASLPHAQCPNDRTMQPTEPPAFTGLKKKLWTAADKLRSNLDAALCKHEMLEATVTKLSATTVSIEVLRRQPAGAQQVEPGRIARMTEELASSIAKIVINARAFQ